MTDHPQGFFQGTEMPTAGWWRHFGLILRRCWLQSGYDPAWMPSTYARATVGSPFKYQKSPATFQQSISIQPCRTLRGTGSRKAAGPSAS
jgi:hypothetical protein